MWNDITAWARGDSGVWTLREWRAAIAGDSGSLNRYIYTLGDPINHLDPGGLADCDPEGITGRVCPALMDGGGPIDSVGSSAYNQYVTSINTYHITVTTTISLGPDSTGTVTTGTVTIGYTVNSPFSLPTSGTIPIDWVTSNITFGSVVSTPTTFVPTWSTTATSGSSPVSQNAITLNLGGFGLFGVFGGYFSFSYIPGSKLVCIGGNVGVGTPGPVVNVGTLSTGPGTNVQGVIEGLSLSGGVNLNPVAGGQVTISQAGTASGVSLVTVGASAVVGYTLPCF